jgi:hypothetical protein
VDNSTFAELVAILTQELEAHKERGLILCGAAVIDRALEDLIRTGFAALSDASHKEIDVFLCKRPNPPLGSASTRARFARVLGVLTPEFSEACCKLFEIRNAFAHQEKPPMLSKKLLLPIWTKIPQELRAAFGAEPQEPAAFFRHILSVILFQLHFITSAAKSRTVAWPAFPPYEDGTSVRNTHDPVQVEPNLLPPDKPQDAR